MYNNKLEEEIEFIKEELKDIRKKTYIKNLKISKKVFKRVAPYVLSASIVAGGFKLVGAGLPFYNDNVKKTAEVKSEFDASGRLIKSERVYGSYDFEEKINRVIIYGKWNNVKDNEYEREVLSYKINKKDFANIMSIDDIDNIDFNKLFGKPYMHVYETSYDLGDIDNDGFVKIILYSKDKDDYIIVKQGFKENIGTSFGAVAIIFLIYSIIGIYRSNYSNFDYRYEVEGIKYRYRDVEKLKKKLKKELKKKREELKK